MWAMTVTSYFTQALELVPPMWFPAKPKTFGWSKLLCNAYSTDFV